MTAYYSRKHSLRSFLCGEIPWDFKSVPDYLHLLFLIFTEDSCLKQLLCWLLSSDYFPILWFLVHLIKFYWVFPLVHSFTSACSHILFHVLWPVPLLCFKIVSDLAMEMPLIWFLCLFNCSHHFEYLFTLWHLKLFQSALITFLAPEICRFTMYCIWM